MIKRITVSDKTKKEANHWGQWVVIAAILALVGLAFLDSDDDYEAAPVAALYAAPTYYAGDDELWQEICRIQRELEMDLPARCQLEER